MTWELMDQIAPFIMLIVIMYWINRIGKNIFW